MTDNVNVSINIDCTDLTKRKARPVVANAQS